MHIAKSSLRISLLWSRLSRTSSLMLLSLPRIFLTIWTSSGLFSFSFSFDILLTAASRWQQGVHELHKLFLDVDVESIHRSAKRIGLKNFIKLIWKSYPSSKADLESFCIHKSISRKIHKKYKRSRSILHWCRQVEGDQFCFGPGRGEGEGRLGVGEN